MAVDNSTRPEMMLLEKSFSRPQIIIQRKLRHHQRTGTNNLN
jgi:hypothetical protein